MPIKETELKVCKVCKRMWDGSGPICSNCEKEAETDDFGETDYYDEIEDEYE